MIITTALKTLGMTLGLALLAGPTAAQNFPVKPIRLIIPFSPPGGPVDLTVRPFAEKLGEFIGQPIVVENVGGAGTMIGSDLVAKSAPDGYTLLITSAAIMIMPSSNPKMPFDLMRDLTPVGTVSQSTIVLVVDPKLGFRNIPDLVAYAKANPGKLAFGSTGAGGSLHLGGEMLKLMAGIDMTHIPYKGAAQALIDIMGGHLSMTFVSMAAVLPLAKSGKIQPLAVAALKRNTSLPDLPTMDSLYPGFEVTASNSILAPAKTPAANITRINQAMAKSLSSPSVKDAFAKSGVEPVISTPEEFGAAMRVEVARWAKVVKAINFVQVD